MTIVRVSASIKIRVLTVVARSRLACRERSHEDESAELSWFGDVHRRPGDRGRGGRSLADPRGLAARTRASIQGASSALGKGQDRRRTQRRASGEMEGVQGDRACARFAPADANPTDPAAIDAIVWTIHGLVNGCYVEYRAEQSRAYNLLAEKALSSEKVVPICYYAGGEGFFCPEARNFLEQAIAKSPIRLVRGTACLGLAIDDQKTAQLVQKSRDPIVGEPLRKRLEEWKNTGVIAPIGRLDPEALERQAEARFERVVGEFGDLKMAYPYNETPFAELARGSVRDPPPGRREGGAGAGRRGCPRRKAPAGGFPR